MAPKLPWTPRVEAGMPFERAIGSGEPAPTLIEITERYDCEAIILGARGLGGLSGALLGSVSQAVLHTSRVPVTVVRRVHEAMRHPEPSIAVK
jgi:nucleotide-binding universal stress UspA family protein